MPLMSLTVQIVKALGWAVVCEKHRRRVSQAWIQVQLSCPSGMPSDTLLRLPGPHFLLCKMPTCLRAHEIKVRQRLRNTRPLVTARSLTSNPALRGFPAHCSICHLALYMADLSGLLWDMSGGRQEGFESMRSIRQESQRR